MTEERYQAIQKMADEKEMSMGSYIVNSAIHSQKSVTPEIIVSIQNIVNTAYVSVEAFAPDKAKKWKRRLKGYGRY